jgi:RNA polymerase sigma factor (sigma-70 family)
MDAPAIALAVAVDTAADDVAARIGALFDRHHQRLFKLARRLSRSSEDARDLVQETFLRAARSPRSIPAGATHEEAWLVRVLINICRDGWRQQAVRAGSGCIQSGAVVDGEIGRGARARELTAASARDHCPVRNRRSHDPGDREAPRRQAGHGALALVDRPSSDGERTGRKI